MFVTVDEDQARKSNWMGTKIELYLDGNPLLDICWNISLNSADLTYPNFVLAACKHGAEL